MSHFSSGARVPAFSMAPAVAEMIRTASRRGFYALRLDGPARQLLLRTYHEALQSGVIQGAPLTAGAACIACLIKAIRALTPLLDTSNGK